MYAKGLHIQTAIDYEANLPHHTHGTDAGKCRYLRAEFNLKKE